MWTRFRLIPFPKNYHILHDLRDIKAQFNMLVTVSKWTYNGIEKSSFLVAANWLEIDEEFNRAHLITRWLAVCVEK